MLRLCLSSCSHISGRVDNLLETLVTSGVQNGLTEFSSSHAHCVEEIHVYKYLIANTLLVIKSMSWKQARCVHKRSFFPEQWLYKCLDSKLNHEHFLSGSSTFQGSQCHLYTYIDTEIVIVSQGQINGSNKYGMCVRVKGYDNMYNNHNCYRSVHDVS